MSERDELLDKLRLAAAALSKTRIERDNLLRKLEEPIAIVGVACRLPGGVTTADEYWRMLDEGRDGVASLEKRWALIGATQPADVPHWAGLLEDVDQFDAAFFGISPREAASLDPQQRILLEVAWEALENAGLTARSLESTRTGVFVGACSADYAHGINASPIQVRDAYSTTGNMLSVAAGRLSYTFGWQGPCVTLDTACSSSLVAIHLACRSLRSGESDLALAGGVNLLLSPHTMVGLARTQALSPDGRCRSFDAGANGFVRGEGCGLVVLKRLSDALRDGDMIAALIRGSAVNQDGRSTGLTAPNVLSQQLLLRDALTSARLDPGAISYVEAHGTGTSLGDPIEMDALRAVLGDPSAEQSDLIVGAVKTNIGHLEAAAGIAGVLKVVLALEHERIPRNLNFRHLNPRIQLEGSRLVLATHARPWLRGTRQRFAGVSGFGMSGTNAHVILEEPPPPGEPPHETPRATEPVLLSAKSERALDETVVRFREWLTLHPHEHLSDIAFSTATSRDHHPHRMMIVAASTQGLAQTLAQLTAGATPENVMRGTPAESVPRLAFTFADARARPGLGRQLSEAFPPFRAAFEAACAAFATHLARPLEHVLWGMTPVDLEELSQREYGDAAVFAFEWALAALWFHCGAKPTFVAGSSLGELSAAAVAGILPLDTAAALVVAHARGTSGGATIATTTPRWPMLASRAGASASDLLSSDYWTPAALDAVKRLDPAAQRADQIDWVVTVAPDEGAELPAFWRALGDWHVRGGAAQWHAVFPSSSRRVRLPQYPWQRERHWLDLPASALAVASSAEAETEVERYIGRHTRLAEGSGEVFDALWSTERFGFLREHQVYGRIVVPAAAQVSRVLSLARSRLGRQAVTVGNIGFERALALREGEERTLQLTLQAPVGATQHFSISSLGESGWSKHVSGELQEAQETLHFAWKPRAPVSASQRADRFYPLFEKSGVTLGAAFRWVDEVWQDPEGVGGTTRPERNALRAGHALPPGLLDSCFQILVYGADALEMAGESSDSACLPIFIERLTISGDWRGEALECRVRDRQRRGADELSATIEVASVSGTFRMWVKGLRCRRAPKSIVLHDLIVSERVPVFESAWVRLAASSQGGSKGESSVPLVLLSTGSDGGSLEPETGQETQRWTPAELEARLTTGEASEKGIVYVAPATGAADSPPSSEIEQFFSAARVCLAHDLPLHIVTQRAHPVLPGEEVQNLLGAGVWGAVRALRAEGLRGLSLDFDVLSECGDALRSELDRATDESEIAYRAGQRYVNRVTAKSQGDTHEPPKLDGEAVYACSGGFGGVGSRALAWLAQRGAKRLWVIGRRELSPAALRQQEQALHLPSGTLVYSAIDLATDDAEARLRAQAAALGHPVKGVIHAAGTTADAALRDQNPHTLRSVIAPKADGALRLARCLAGQPLEFFLNLSSLSALLGNTGQSNYAFANAVLDALPYTQAGRAARMRTAALGPVEGPGLFERQTPALKRALLVAGFAATRETELGRIFDAGVGADMGTLAFARIDWKKFAASRPEQAARLQKLGIFSHAAPPPAGEFASALARLSADEREPFVARSIQQEVAAVLDLGEPASISVEKPLIELGLDSLMAVELRERLNSLCQISLPSTVVFDHPSVRALSREVLRRASPTSARSALSASAPSRGDDTTICVVGMSGRFPHPSESTLEAFWELLLSRGSACREVPRERWNIDDYYDPDPNAPGKMNTRHGGFLGQIDVTHFDAGYFGIAPKETESMDPQHRLLLECTIEALEDARIDPKSLSGVRAGVFIGISTSDYSRLLSQRGEASIDPYFGTGTAHSVAAGRISYVLGLQGPSLAIDTACSSSLYAVDQACRSLREGECELAIVGGVNLLLAPELTIYFSKGRFMAPDGKCKTFDAAADGYVRGEGCGVLVLKRGSEAKRDGDRVRAIVRASAVNQDGRSGSLTAPNGPAQEAVIRHALRQAGLQPSDVSYVEAHGTGTQLGDPIEINALANAYGEGRPVGRPLLIGSVKTNIGHLESASGMASLVKVILALEREVIPPQVHFSQPNRKVAWEKIQASVVTGSVAWQRTPGRPRRAGISSFAVQGSNAHVIIEEAPDTERSAPATSDTDRPFHLFAVSAKSAWSLAENARRYAETLALGNARLPDAAHTSLVARGHWQKRLAIVGRDTQSVVAALRAFVAGEPTSDALVGETPPDGSAPRVAFVFTGAGAQHAGMGLSLYERAPRFKAALDACAERLEHLLPTHLHGVIYGGDEAMLSRPEYAHPAHFALQYALAELWMSWGLKPAAVVGEGVGSYTAAVIAGVLSLEAALALVVVRARLSERITGVEGEALFRELVARASSVTREAARVEYRSAPSLLDTPQMLSPTNVCVERDDTFIDHAVGSASQLYVELGPDARLAARLAHPPNVRGLITSSLRRGDDHWKTMLGALAALHVRGAAVDWLAYDAPYARAKIDLPSYQFDRSRYWFEQPRSEHQGLVHRLAWEPLPIERGTRPTPRHLAVCGDAALAREMGKHSIPAKYLNEASALGSEPSHDSIDDVVVSLPSAAAASAEARYAASLYAVEQLAAAWRFVIAKEQRRLWIVSHGAHGSFDGSPIVPEQAAIVGLGKVLALEGPTHLGAAIDVGADAPASAIAEALAFELMTGGADVVSWRGAERRGERLVHVDTDTGIYALDDTSHCLITGGLGGLGLELAEWLARKGAGTIQILSRRDPHEDRQRAALQRIASLGISLQLSVIDASDPTALAELFRRSAEERRPITHVFHCAGSFRSQPAERIDAVTLSATMRAKVLGALLLDALCREHGVDTFVMYGSGAAVWGGMNQGAYAAANAILGAIAEGARRDGHRWLCVEWGPWQAEGMAADTEMRAGLERIGVRSLKPPTALRVLEGLLAGNHASGFEGARRVVVDMDYRRFAAVYAARSERGLLRSVAPPPSTIAPERTPAPRKESRSSNPAPTGSSIANIVADVVSAATAHRELAFETPFMDLGVDSLMAVEIRDQLAKRLGKSLPATLVFDYPNVHSLSAHLVDMLSGARDSVIGEFAIAAPDEPIAIVGMGCRLPGGADSPAKFWDLLDSGRDAIVAAPSSRWHSAQWLDPSGQDPTKSYVDAAGFLLDVDRFDATLFGIGAAEANAMDPQHRMVLECAWHALESAGIAPDTLRGARAGVFLGITVSEYGGLGPATPYTVTGTSSNAAPGRVAYLLGLEGPALAIDTACSSSLSALHIACESLLRGESNLALAGGVNALLSPHTFAALCQIRALSRDGRCRAFSADAGGYGRGEGCAMFVLKRLRDAVRDGDEVLALIRGSALNQDGRSSGFTAPNGPSQQRVIRDALASARLAPADLDYVEAHGTGTTLGDPIEAQALAAVLSEGRDSSQPLLLGTAKSNIGHLESASGAAGVMKVVLALMHERLPKTLHAERLNPHVAWGDLPLKVLSQGSPWARRPDRPRRAGVSSFGITGTNAHLIIEEAPHREATHTGDAEPGRQHLLIVQARSRASLDELCASYAGALERFSLADVAFSALTGRAKGAFAKIVIADDASGARDALRQQPVRQIAAAAPRLAFIFLDSARVALGQGRALFDNEARFREAWEECAALVATELGESVDQALLGNDPARLANPRYNELACFAFGYALARLWLILGVKPAFFVGYGVGAYAAATIAGVLSLGEAVALASAHGRALERQAHGHGTPEGVAAPMAVLAARRTQSPAAVSVKDDIEAAREAGATLFLALGDEIRAGADGMEEAAFVSSVRPSGDGWRDMLAAVAELYTRGVSIDWQSFESPSQRRRVPLPTYPFDRHRYWHGAELASGTGTPPLLRFQRAPDAASFEMEVSLATAPELADHVVFDGVVVPGAFYLSKLLLLLHDQPELGNALSDVSFESPLWLDEHDSVRVRLSLTPDAEAPRRFSISCRTDAGGWRTLGEGAFMQRGQIDLSPPKAERSFDAEITGDQFYVSAARHAQLHLGPSFQWVTRKAEDEGGGRTLLRAARPEEWGSSHTLPAGLIDSCFQGSISAKVIEREAGDLAGIFVGVGGVSMHAPWSGASLRLEFSHRDPLVADAIAYDERGAAVLSLTKIRTQFVRRDAFERTKRRPHTSSPMPLYEQIWRTEEFAEPPLQELRWHVTSPDTDLLAVLANSLSTGSANLEVVGIDALCARAVDALDAPLRLLYVVPAPPQGFSVQPAVELERAIRPLLELLRHFKTRRTRLCLTIATQGAQCTGADDGAPSPTQASVWGMMRSIAQESPDWDVRLIDVWNYADAAQALWCEARGESDEDEVVLRPNARLVPRVQPLNPGDPPLQIPTGSENYALRVRRRGTFENLAIVPIERATTLADHEVEIAVATVGLNFRDVLNALGLYPGDPGEVGGDLAGIVTRAGRAVSHVRVGDRVFGFGSGSIARFAIAPAHLVFRCPVELNDAEAVTLLITHMTASYALHDVAKVARGERVLIHAAAGGVGLTAIVLAREAGAEIYATASLGKHAFLRELGVERVYDSRSESFYEEILRDTGGEGVDIAINSLTGGKLKKTALLLRKGGRFVEIGKTELLTQARFQELNPGATYTAVALDTMMSEQPEWFGPAFERLCRGVEEGRYKAIAHRTFGIRDARSAFRFLAQGKNVGKVVICVNEALASVPHIDPTGVYLLTGGFGALGRAVAERLAKHGAKHLLLVGRSPPGQQAHATLERIRGLGAEVLEMTADVSDPEQVGMLATELKRLGRRLAGVVHAAGALSDAMLHEQSWERYEHVLGAKARGANHLAGLLEESTWVAYFASVSGVFGNAGQSNYAAANAYLDAMAIAQRRSGRLALSIDWGPWAEAGMASSLRDRRAGTDFFGWRAIDNEEGLDLFDAALERGPAQSLVITADWQRWATYAKDRGLKQAKQRALFASVGVRASETKVTAPATTSFVQRLLAEPENKRPALVAEALTRELTQILGHPHPNISPKQPLVEAGLDSLMAVELRNRLSALLGRPLPSTVVFDHPSIDALALYLLLEISSGSPQAQTRAVTPQVTSHAVAVIGYHCRFPGPARNPEAYWDSLREGVSSITEVPRERWDINAYYDPDPDTPGKMSTRFGSFLRDHPAEFDAAFFGISPREAQTMDPQQRLVLECVVGALEQAGIVPETLAGTRTGVFLGISTSDYAQLLSRSGEDNIDAYRGTGTAFSVAAGRISYLFGLQGPSFAIDTACSSSLYALHQARESLIRGECDLALVAGVNMMLAPDASIYFSKAHFMAPDGRCKTFAADANGYVRGEGCGVLVLQREAEAAKEGKRIRALVRGSAINQDGRSGGLTVPNGPAQSAVIRAALESANLSPAQVSYVEVHGTGTPLGDPIELHALCGIYGEGRPVEKPLLVGSVKTNFGHLEAASGMASLIKVILALEHEELPAQLPLGTPNPNIDWTRLPTAVVTRRAPWRRGGAARVAGVSAFAFQGSNAHVIIEEAPPIALPPRSHPTDRSHHLFVVSAKSAWSCAENAKHYADRLATASEAFANIAHTSLVARTHWHKRLAAVGRDGAEVAAKIRAHLDGAIPSGLVAGDAAADGRPPKITLVFAGHGPAFLQVAPALYESAPAFKKAIDTCDARSRAILPVPLRDLLLTGRDPSQWGPACVDAALFALEYALAELWKSWGIHADCALGEGIGEYVAAAVAGVFQLDVAFDLVMRRAALTGGQEPISEAARTADFLQRAASAARAPTELTLLSTLPFLRARGEGQDSQTWTAAQGDALASLVAQAGDTIFVEIGPNSELHATAPSAVVSTLRRGLDPWETMLTALAELYVRGVKIDFDGYDAPYARVKADLPTYCFERHHYWFDILRERISAHDPWNAVCARLADAGPSEATLEARNFHRLALARRGTKLISDALIALGIAGENEERFLARAVHPRYAGLVHRWITHLRSSRTIVCSGDRLELDAGALSELEKAGPLDTADGAAELLERVGPSLVNVVRRDTRVEPRDLMYPQGSDALVRRVYAEDEAARDCNAQYRRLFAELVATLPAASSIRVLEVGGGTGATTEQILQVLPPDRSRYTFTDISTYFTKRARERFAHFGFVEDALLDLDRPTTAQGFSPGSFDIIIAVNVLHAVKHLTNTLQDLAALLAPGGFLVSTEVTEYSAFFDATFGLMLLDFEREGERTDGMQFLTVRGWERALRNAGFDRFGASPRQENAGQHLLIGRRSSNGSAARAFTHEVRRSVVPARARHPFLGERSASGSDDVTLYHARPSDAEIESLALDGDRFAPSSLYGAIALAAGRELLDRDVELASQDVVSRVHIVPGIELRTSIRRSAQAPDELELEVASRREDGSEWHTHVHAVVRRGVPLSSLLAQQAGRERLVGRLSVLVADTGGFGDHVSTGANLAALGFDSLMFVELLARIEEDAGLRLPRTRLHADFSVEMLSALLMESYAPAGAVAPPDPIDDAHVSEIDGALIEAELPTMPFELEHARRLLVQSRLGTMEALLIGAGEPCLLLPPFGCDFSVWWPAAQRLQRERQCVLLNFPGYGQTTMRRVSVKQLADWVAQTLRSIDVSKPMEIIGWSLGGFVAQHLVAEQPERIARVVLVSTSSKLMKHADDLREVADLTRRLTVDLEDECARVDSGERVLYRQLVGSGRERAGQEALWAQMNAVLAFDGAKLVYPSPRPTLIVGGECDLPVPPEHVLKLMQIIPGSMGHLMAGAGHYVPLFHVDRFLSLLSPA